MLNNNETLSPEIVESVLEDLKDTFVFSRFRSTVHGSGTFFDPEQGYVNEGEASAVETVLNTYLEAITANDPVAVNSLKEPEVRKSVMDALTPGSIQRQVLLGYFGLREDSPWCEAEHLITTRQTFNAKDFPSFSDIDKVLSNL